MNRPQRQDRASRSAALCSTSEILPKIVTSKSRIDDSLASELSSFTRFVDFGGKKLPTTNGAMKIIKSRLDQTASSKLKVPITIRVKENNVNDFNSSKYSSINNTHINNYSKFVFEDRNLYKIYMQLCNKRDSIPPCSPDRVEYLKRTDPIFSKRYRQFNFAVSCGNKAVKFANKTVFISPYVPKGTVEPKAPTPIVEILPKNSHIDRKLKLETEMIREKTRLFVRSIESLH